MLLTCDGFEEWNIHSIPLSIPLILIRVAGRWSRSQLTLGEGRVHPGQVASPSRAHIETDNHLHSHSHLWAIQRAINLLHVFGLWEEAGEIYLIIMFSSLFRPAIQTFIWCMFFSNIYFTIQFQCLNISKMFNKLLFERVYMCYFMINISVNPSELFLREYIIQ